MKLLVWIFFSGILLCAHSRDTLNVPKDVMSFIMECDKRHIEPRTGSTASETYYPTVNVSQLQDSLREIVGSEDEIERIVSYVESAVVSRSGAHGSGKPEGCVNIFVDNSPPETVTQNEDLITIIEQSNYQLLEQINNLLEMKFVSFGEKLEALISNQTEIQKESNKVLLEEVKSLFADLQEPPFSSTVHIVNSTTSNNASTAKREEVTPMISNNFPSEEFLTNPNQSIQNESHTDSQWEKMEVTDSTKAEEPYVEKKIDTEELETEINRSQEGHAKIKEIINVENENMNQENLPLSELRDQHRAWLRKQQENEGHEVPDRSASTQSTENDKLQPLISGVNYEQTQVDDQSSSTSSPVETLNVEQDEGDGSSTSNINLLRMQKFRSLSQRRKEMLQRMRSG